MYIYICKHIYTQPPLKEAFILYCLNMHIQPPSDEDNRYDNINIYICVYIYIYIYII